MDTLNRVYRIESEWDFGQEYLTFASKGACTVWLQSNATFIEMAQAEGLTPGEFYWNCRNDNLISYSRLGVIL